MPDFLENLRQPLDNQDPRKIPDNPADFSRRGFSRNKSIDNSNFGKGILKRVEELIAFLVEKIDALNHEPSETKTIHDIIDQIRATISELVSLGGGTGNVNLELKMTNERVGYLEQRVLQTFNELNAKIEGLNQQIQKLTLPSKADEIIEEKQPKDPVTLQQDQGEVDTSVDLSQAQQETLELFRDNPNQILTIKEVQAKLELKRYVTAHSRVKTLLEKGLLEKSRQEGRVSFYKLTAKDQRVEPQQEQEKVKNLPRKQQEVLDLFKGDFEKTLTIKEISGILELQGTAGNSRVKKLEDRGLLQRVGNAQRNISYKLVKGDSEEN